MHFNSSTPVLDETDERARRAVKVFRGMQPTLTAFAQVLTHRRDIHVVMSISENGATDGKKIFYRPPIKLGDELKHERSVCDKRDEHLQLRCPACSSREEILVTIYHEIAHIAFDSFAEPSEHDKITMIAEATRGMDTEFAKKVADKIQRTYYGDYRTMVAAISPYLPIIFNALDDARVNAAGFEARRGTKVMFDADIYRVFTEGVEQVGPDGRTIVKSWKDYEQNSQVIVGLFLLASGYEINDWLIPPVIEALSDPELQNLMRRIKTMRQPRHIYEIIFPVLARLRDLGFCKSKEEQKEEQNEEGDPRGKDSPESQSQDDGDESGDSDTSGSDDSSGDNDESDSDSVDDQSSDSDPDSGGMDEADDPEDGSSEPSDSEDGDGDNGNEDGEGPSSEGSSSPEGTSEEGDVGDEADNESMDPSGGDGESADSESAEMEGASGDDATDPDPDGPSDSGDSDEGDSDSLPEGEGSSDDSSPPDGSGPAGSGSPEPGNEEQVDENSSGSPEAADSSTESSDDSGSEAGDSSDGDSGRDGSGAAGNLHGGDTSGSDDLDSDGNLGNDGEAEANPDLRDQDGFDRSRERADSLDRADGDDGDSSPSARDDELADVPVETPESSGEATPIDSGADDGTGGVQVVEHSSWDDVPMGDEDDAKAALDPFVHSGEKPRQVEEPAAGSVEETIDRAVVQGIYFETPSKYIFGVRNHFFDNPVIADGVNVSKCWKKYSDHESSRRGQHFEYTHDESILGPVLTRMRVAFTANRRGSQQRHLKSGHVDAAVLGKRANLNDERLFKRKTLPGKRDYFVCIGIDVSGSTMGTNILLAKEAAFAQAELLKRLGVKFAMYAHTSSPHSPRDGRGGGSDVDIYHLKDVDEPWNKKTQERVARLGSGIGNLDGHSMEYYRKVCDAQTATDKIILYYTDGKMPAENYDEELEVLTREIRECKRRNYTLLGVGIRTDSPTQHGLETVQIDNLNGLGAVIAQLGRHLAKKN